LLGKFVKRVIDHGRERHNANDIAFAWMSAQAVTAQENFLDLRPRAACGSKIFNNLL
jgi:hypothetical protein